MAPERVRLAIASVASMLRRSILYRMVIDVDAHRSLLGACFTTEDQVRMAAFLPGIDFPQIILGVGEIAGKCVPGIRLRLHHKRYTPRGELLMHRPHPVAAFYLDRRHRPPAAPRGKPRRQLQ